MRRVTEGGEFEARLALAAPVINRATGGACLRGIAGIDENDLATPFLELVGQLARHLVPADVENGPVQPRFRPNTCSRLIQSAFCGAGHVTGIERLHHHHRIPAGDIRCGLMLPMLPDAGPARLETCRTAQRLAMSVRAPGLAGRGALGAAMPLIEITERC